MRILFLTTQLPYPPKSGGVIKSWNLVKHWADKYDLSLAHPLKNDDHIHLEDFTEQIELEHHYTEPIERKRTGLNLLRSYLGHASLNVFRNYSKSLEQFVGEIHHEVDVIFVDHYEMGQYVPSDYKGKVVLHEHNAEFIMWLRLGELESNPIKKLILNLESKRILAAEKKYAERADLVLAAPNDITELAGQGVQSDKMRTTYHLGEDFMLQRPDMEFEETELALLYVGTLSWEANVDGLIWFIEKCWKDLQIKHPGLSLTVVGKNPDQRILQAASTHDGIHFKGFIEDLEECYPSHRVFIVPLRFGSGIKVKVLNAMYRGIPMVTTDIGAEGLSVQNGVELYECTGQKDFVEKTSILLSDKEKWNAMRDASRCLARQYTWSHLLAEHDEALEQLL